MNSPEDVAMVHGLMNQLMTEISAILGREVTTAILRSAVSHASSEFPILGELPITTEGIQITTFVTQTQSRSQEPFDKESEVLNASLRAFTQRTRDVIYSLTGSILATTLEFPFAAIFQALHSGQGNDRR